MDVSFFLQNALLGVGLAMDAFSVSLANGLREPQMGRGRMAKIAGVYGGFQYLMPMLGWVCVHTVVNLFSSLEKIIPWIAFALLGWIGGKMLWEGLREHGDPDRAPTDRSLTPRDLLMHLSENSFAEIIGSVPVVSLPVVFLTEFDSRS